MAELPVRSPDTLAVASVKVFLIGLDLGEYACVSFKRFSLFRLPDDRVTLKRTVGVLPILMLSI